MNTTKKARIRYDEKNDRFIIEINTGDGWDLDVNYQSYGDMKSKCFKKIRKTPGEIRGLVFKY